MNQNGYDLIAACLGGAFAAARTEAAQAAVNDVLMRLSLELELDNPRFDRVKFMAAVRGWEQKHGDE